MPTVNMTDTTTAKLPPEERPGAIVVPAQMHRAVKLAAVRSGQTMQEIAAEALMIHLGATRDGAARVLDVPAATKALRDEVARQAKAVAP